MEKGRKGKGRRERKEGREKVADRRKVRRRSRGGGKG